LHAVDDIGLRLTSKRCRRRSRDISSVSGSRRRRMSSPALLPLTSSGGALFGRSLDDISQPDLPQPLIQVGFLYAVFSSARTCTVLTCYKAR